MPSIRLLRHAVLRLVLAAPLALPAPLALAAPPEHLPGLRAAASIARDGFDIAHIQARRPA